MASPPMGGAPLLLPFLPWSPWSPGHRPKNQNRVAGNSLASAQRSRRDLHRPSHRPLHHHRRRLRHPL